MTRPTLTALCGLLVVTAGCNSPPAAEITTAAAEVTAVPVRAVALKDGAGFVVARHPAVATARTDGVVAVASPCEGRVIAIHVNEGDAVVGDAPLADIACLDAGLLSAREAGQAQRTRALDRRVRELRALRADGLVDLQRVVEIERELLTARTEHVETKALIARAGLGKADDKGDATITLYAPQDGVVSHISGGAGNLIDRVGVPLITLNRMHTTRVEADAFAAPGGTESFVFRGSDGVVRPLGLVSVRAVSRDPDDLTSTRLRLTFEVSDATQAPLPVGIRGQVEASLVEAQCRVLPAHAVQRRARGDHSSEFCVFAMGADGTCIPVEVWPGESDTVMVCGEGLPPVGAEVLSHLPSWTTHNDAPGEAPDAGLDEK